MDIKTSHLVVATKQRWVWIETERGPQRIPGLRVDSEIKGQELSFLKRMEQYYLE